MDINLEGLKELAEDLEKIYNGLPYAKDELLEKSGRKLRNICKDKTPYKEGDKIHIKNKYKLSKVKRESNIDYIEMANTAPHFHLVEHGHYQVVGGKKDKGGKIVGFVPGVHMVERGTEQFKEEYPEIVGKMLDRMLKKVDR
ncbi:HK97 gp10 family phage protein [Clostridium tetani]|uniref:HK97 gp10 family phage protein n=1 Tax=Clostridium tetani TaxID=1513 RepID=UPI001025DE0D|nr:HK97 gp10 family phage protein [Clostridium tetani]RXI70503.1 hypothetical protein DP127_09400 [Clostridium tetani]